MDPFLINIFIVVSYNKLGDRKHKAPLWELWEFFLKIGISKNFKFWAWVVVIWIRQASFLIRKPRPAYDP